MTIRPHLRRDADRTRLIVDGEPFLILGGEIGNSSASSAATLQTVWPPLRAMHVNTVLAPVYWELIEPEEGRFDFSSVDELLEQARANGMRLVILWFGAWKNSMSTYTPAWVKRDTRRFPHARLPDGRPVEILSAHGEQTLAADVAAYTALLRHLRDVDGAQHTVLLMQIENEIGFLPVARDHGPLAQEAWTQPVPAALIDRLNEREALEPELRALWERHGTRTDGTWAEVFGDEPAGHEVFAAWHYARFVDVMSSRGKGIYPLPTFVNCALNRPGRAPGEYPSAGPLPHLLDVWQAGAPSLDMLSPDVYFYNYADWTERYRKPGNALFVPETMHTARASANAMITIARQRAIGFSPFALEDATGLDAEMLGHTYAAMRQLTPILTGQSPSVFIDALSPKVNYDGTIDPSPQIVTVGEFRLTITFDDLETATTPLPSTGAPQIRGGSLPRSGGMILFTGPDAYSVVGTGLKITHAPMDGDGAVGLLEVEEWRVDGGGAWSPFRRLNGDQTNQGREVRLFPGQMRMQTVRLYRYR